MRPRTALALGLAGLATAGLGIVAPSAGAEVRTFEITLIDGKVVTVTVDVAPGTQLWDISFPGVPADQIRAIAEVPTPAGVAGAESPAATAPRSTTPTQTSTAPATTTPTTPTPAEEPKAGREPEPRGRGSKQRTTGSRQRVDRDGRKRSADRDRPRRSEDREHEAEDARSGLPSIHDPQTSIATPGPVPIGVPNVFIEKFRIPPFLLPIYQAAGMEYGIRWEILAAINEIETDYGRNLNVSSAGAIGWMQFLPSTWEQYGVDANGDGRKDPYNPVDAIFAAARYLRAAGADKDLRRAIYAYNHADWYVDSVLMRARLIGGLPANLVGSLTGLTQGRFPVAATARYRGAITARQAERRVERGRNPARPVEPDPERRGIDIFAKPGSPVVAVQDGKIVRIGHHPRLGRFIQLRDAYGNTYTYAKLKKIAATHPVPKQTPTGSARPLADPPEDPAPRRPATAGTQRPATRQDERAAGSASDLEARDADELPVAKERLYAAPTRPRAYRAGGREQLESEVTASAADLLNLPPEQVEMRRLRVGSRVIAGTILGRIGTNDEGRAPHMRFEIRPAGRGAPRIDPKPILDGWKLLETTAIYRAKGKNPFVGEDARQPTIGQLLLMGKADLQRRVLENPRIEIYACGRRDIRAGRIDRRVLATLEFLAASGLRPTVTSLECGHSTYTTSGNVSHHASGNAVDIAKINGIPIAGNQGKDSITDITIRRLLTLQGTMKPAQIISLMSYEGADNTLAMADHDDHIHIGFTPYADTNSRRARDLGTMLEPRQWTRLIERLGEIDNPTVLPRPSKHAIPVEKRASRAHRGE
jgi:murein DD-endopeptidase MepM/ murein hydrolase activator NlpD